MFNDFFTFLLLDCISYGVLIFFYNILITNSFSKIFNVVNIIHYIVFFLNNYIYIHSP